MALDACERLRQWWAKTGKTFVPEPASDEQIQALERRYGITLPDDFRAYLQALCPAKISWDAEDGSWFTFKQIEQSRDERAGEVISPVNIPHASQYLFFMDYLIWSHAWAVSCTDDENRGKILLIAGMPNDRFVADSFTKFVERYTSEDYSVWPS